MFGFSAVPAIRSYRLFGPRLRYASPPPNAFHAHDSFAHYGEVEVHSEESVARELELKRQTSVDWDSASWHDLGVQVRSRAA